MSQALLYSHYTFPYSLFIPFFTLFSLTLNFPWFPVGFQVCAAHFFYLLASTPSFPCFFLVFFLSFSAATGFPSPTRRLISTLSPTCPHAFFVRSGGQPESQVAESIAEEKTIFPRS